MMGMIKPPRQQLASLPVVLMFLFVFVFLVVLASSIGRRRDEAQELNRALRTLEQRQDAINKRLDSIEQNNKRPDITEKRRR